MKINKKTILFICTALFATSILTTSAFAFNVPEVTPPDQESVLRAEITEWVYRNNNGITQKRLWSRTYQKWLTDWINV